MKNNLFIQKFVWRQVRTPMLRRYLRETVPYSNYLSFFSVFFLIWEANPIDACTKTTMTIS